MTMSGDKLTAKHLPKLSEVKSQRVTPGEYLEERASRFLPEVVSPQEAICEFLLFIVKKCSPETVLSQFQELFMRHTYADEFALECLSKIILDNQEQEFCNLLRRGCYILINNWDISRNHDYIYPLIRLFEDPSLQERTDSLILGRLRGWIRNFVASPDFEALKLVTHRFEERETGHWSRRYTSYLLAPQYANLENPLEQRQVAKKVSRQLKDKFKFDLAMYTARSESAPGARELKNPTSLGDEVLRLIKKVVVKRGTYSYPSLAKIFLQQTQESSYKAFKKSLLEYLFFGIEPDDFAEVLKQRLAAQLSTLYFNSEDKQLDEALLLRTVKRLAESLTMERNGEPSDLFILLSSQQNPLVLVILLLKLTLICRYVKTHLEVCIANAVTYYEGYQEQDCAWVIQFLELFTIISAIYSENVEYSLVNMENRALTQCLQEGVEDHRIFSLQKHVASRFAADSVEKMIAPLSL
jgi:hypothetical protein